MPYGWRDDSVKAAQGLLQRAQAGDRAAEDQLRQAAQTWSPQHRNAAIDALNTLDPTSHLAHVKNEHGFLGDWGEGLGSILKVAAPIAGALIPGVGALGAMAIGAGGSAAGGALHHDPFNALKTLAAGGAAAAGNKALGNGLGSVAPKFADSVPAASLTNTGQPGSPGTPGSMALPATPYSPAVPGTMPTPATLPTQGMEAVPGAPASGGGLFGSFKTPGGALDYAKLASSIAPVAAGGLGMIEARNKRNSQERLYGQQFNASKAQTAGAEANFAQRQAGLNSAMKSLGGLRGRPSIYG